MAEPTPPQEPDAESRFDRYNRVVLFTLGGSLGALFLIAVLLAWTLNQDIFTVVEFIRDVLLIMLMLSFLLAMIGLSVFLAQMARFINLLQSEFRIILQSMQDTVRTVQTSAEFVSQNAVGPIIRFSSFLAGLAAFFRELAKLSKLIRRPQPKETASDAKP